MLILPVPPGCATSALCTQQSDMEAVLRYAQSFQPIVKKIDGDLCAESGNVPNKDVRLPASFRENP